MQLPWLQVILLCHVANTIWTHYFLSLCFVPSAPSAPPYNVNTLNVTSSTITVHWEQVDCKHQNGLIIGYFVRYGPPGSLNTTLSISGGSVHTITISNLMVSTIYEIEVAAVNSVGIGEFSLVISAETKPCECSFAKLLLQK